MNTERFTKKVLKKTLKAKEDNLVRMYFDAFFQEKFCEGEGYAERFEQIKKEVVEIDNELSGLNSPSMKLKNRLRINELEDKKRKLQAEASGIRDEYAQIDIFRETLKRGIKVVQGLKQAIKNPLIIYGKSKRGTTEQSGGEDSGGETKGENK